jgi:hypothetical protein
MVFGLDTLLLLNRVCACWILRGLTEDDKTRSRRSALCLSQILCHINQGIRCNMEKTNNRPTNNPLNAVMD